MQSEDRPVNILLFSDLAEREAMLIDAFNHAKTRHSVRRLSVSNIGKGWRLTSPDLVLFEFENDQQDTRKSLRLIEQWRRRPNAPVMLITNPHTQDLLENDAVYEAESLSFSAFSLPALAYHLRSDTRENFLSRLRRLYEYGTITVRLPQAVLFRENRRYRASA